jgi:hypothetical protein
MSKFKFLAAGRGAAMCAALGALSLGIAACGSASSTSTAAAGGTAVAGGGSASSRYQARLAFAKCMRSHGVNVPDPSPNGGPPAGGGTGGFRALRSSPNFQSANQACASLRAKAFGFGSLTPAQQAQFRQDLVKFAQCMRAHNIDIPDPSTSSGGGFGILRQIPSSERNSPAFQTALKACSSNLPRPPGRGAGGSGGPPASAPPAGSGASAGAGATAGA